MVGWLSARLGNTRAVENARVACIEASRRRVEREEIALYLARHRGEHARPARSSRGPAQSARAGTAPAVAVR